MSPRSVNRHAAEVPMDTADLNLAPPEVSAMLFRLDALLAQSRALSAEHEAVLNEAEALVTTISDVAHALRAMT